MTGLKPAIHGRDHEHLGADPVRITWEDIGGGGGSGGGSGIQFHSGTYGPTNTGDWLVVNTTSALSGTGMNFTSGSGDILFSASGKTFQVGAGTINLQAGSGATIITFGGSTSLFLISNTNAPSAGIQARLLNHGSYFMISDNTPIIAFSCTPQATTGVIQVNDSTGAAIFRVDNDGSLHGKTGKALTFDL